MNTYHIKYKSGCDGDPYVEADSVNGFDPSCDTYTFKKSGEVVAVVPKAVVASIQKVGSSQ